MLLGWRRPPLAPLHGHVPPMGTEKARKAGSAGSVCVCSASAGGERKERQVQHPKLDINESSPPADGQGVLEDVSISVLLSGK